jgi:tetratricopeptide (TPR) repeat protein
MAGRLIAAEDSRGGPWQHVGMVEEGPRDRAGEPVGDGERGEEPVTSGEGAAREPDDERAARGPDDEPATRGPDDDAMSRGPDGEAAARGPDEAVLAELVERETAYGLLQRGTALLKRRHHAQAAVILERASRLEPGKGSIVEALARAYYNSGQHARAVEAFEELLTIDPSAAYGHYGLGQALKQVGRRAEARTHLRLAVALAPESRLYRDALARLGP